MTEPRKDGLVPADRGQLQIMASLPPLTDALAGVAGTSVVNLGDLPAGILDPFAFVEYDPCTAVRDLFKADPQKAGTVILQCEESHHTERLAHRMTGAGGRTVTWR
jgi:hypothetical protein